MYKVAEGLDIALVSLVAIDPQPRSIGLEYGRESQAASGAVIRESPFIRLLFDVIETQTQYEDLLEQFGLDALVSANVTVLIPGPLYSDVRMSGRAVRPVAGQTVNRQDYFIRDLQIIIKDLEPAA